MKTLVFFFLLSFSTFFCSVEFVYSTATAEEETNSTAEEETNSTAEEETNSTAEEEVAVQPHVFPFVEAPGITNTTLAGCDSPQMFENFDRVTPSYLRIAAYSMSAGSATAVFRKLETTRATASGCAGSTGLCANIWNCWLCTLPSLSIPPEIKTAGFYLSPSNKKMSIKFKDVNDNLIFNFDDEKFLMLVNDNYKGKASNGNNGVKTDVGNYYAYVNFIMEGVGKIEFDFDTLLFYLYRLDNLYLGVCQSSRVDPYDDLILAENQGDDVASVIDENCRAVETFDSSGVIYGSAIRATLTGVTLRSYTTAAGAVPTDWYAIINSCGASITVTFSTLQDYFGFYVSNADKRLMFEFKGDNDAPLYTMRYNAFRSTLTETLGYETEDDKKSGFINVYIGGIKSVKISLECATGDSSSLRGFLGLDNFTIHIC